MKVDYFKSAVLHHSKGNWNKAKEIYEYILKSNPKNNNVLQNYGSLLCQLKEYRLAKKIFEKSLKIKPYDPLTLYNFGKFYHDQKLYDKAIKFYKDSFKIESKNNLSMYNVGNIHLAKNEFDLAILAYKKYLKINTNSYLAYNNLGNSFKNIGNFKEAIKCYQNAIKINKDNPDVHVNYGTQLLMLEDFKEGFEQYEWRKKSKTFLDYINYNKLNLKSKIWKGEDLDDMTLLVISEQGIGDLVQFVRYLYKIKKKYNLEIIIYLKSNKYSHFFDKRDFKTIFDGDDVPHHNYHIHLLSIMGIFEKNNDLFCEPINFFKKNIEVMEKWENKLNTLKGLKVGINSITSLEKKNIPIKYFHQLVSKFSFNFILLQKEFDKNKFYDLINKKNVSYFDNIDNSGKAFEDSIEIIKQLDLIITADTSTAHISATIGIETWIPLPFVSDWRWFLDQKNSKWYKNVNLYRSKKIGDWDSAFEMIEIDLKKNFKV